MSPDAHQTLLVATVGGSPDAIVASLKHWRPSRVVFVASHQSAAQVGEIRALAAGAGAPLPEGSHDTVVVDGAEDLNACVRTVRRLEETVAEWRRRGDGFEIVVDPTGGTKTMAAALALCARRWPCRFSYVGGEQRTRGGVGVVESGFERIVHTANPWDSLGYQAIDDACRAFDGGAFDLAFQALDAARNGADNGRVKRELLALRHLAEAYGAWDRFRHEKAIKPLRDAIETENDLVAAIGSGRAERALGAARAHLQHLERLRDSSTPTRALLVDLLANADRRRNEGRFDDAVARLYRATEVAAQLALRERHGIESTSAVPLDRLPPPLDTDWARQARDDGTVMVGLQMAYELLRALGDPLAERFDTLGLAERKGSPLTARNDSILAHGFKPVGEKVCNSLWTKVLELTEIQPDELPRFPVLSIP